MSRQSEGRTVAELAALVGGRASGDTSARVRGVASIEAAREGDAVFVEDSKLFDAARACAASCVIAPEGACEKLEGARSIIECARPKLAFALIAEVLSPPRRRGAFVHPSSSIAPGARLGEGVYIAAFVHDGEGAEVGDGTQILACAFVGEGARVGRECVLHPNVVLYDGVTLGDRVVLRAGVVVGADGFGYVRDEAGVYHKFPQVGTVVIEDDVEIGALTCVDRAALGTTRVGRGTKIDNLVQVGHNVEIGERVVIAAHAGILGGGVVESDAVIGGQVGFGDHARVQSGAIIGSQAGVLPGKIVRPGVWWGTPAQPLDEYKRQNDHVKGLERLKAEVKAIRKDLGRSDRE